MKMNYNMENDIHSNDLIFKKAEFYLPEFSPIRTSMGPETPALDFKETTKKLDFDNLRDDLNE